MTIATAALVTRAIDILAAAGLRPFVFEAKRDNAGAASQAGRPRADDGATASRVALALAGPGSASAVGVGPRQIP